MSDGNRFQLRYVGTRFRGAKLPLEVLSDLPAFRDLLVAYAKQEWFGLNHKRRRVPKGFDRSISLDLTGVEEGSAVPQLLWNRDVAQQTLPGFSDELEEIVARSYDDIVRLIDASGRDEFPVSLSSEHIRALNKLGAGLKDGERIEFVGSQDREGNVVYLDAYRRKKLITHVRETYQSRYEGVGVLRANSAEGWAIVDTPDLGELKIPVDQALIYEEFDGNLGAAVQLDIIVELDSFDRFRSVAGVKDISLVDADILAELSRCQQRLNDISNLPKGWHHDTGERVSPQALGVANQLLMKRPSLCSSFRIFPTLQGGVLIEFDANGWDISIEISFTGELELYGVEIAGPGELDDQIFPQIDEAFLAALDLLVGL